MASMRLAFLGAITSTAIVFIVVAILLDGVSLNAAAWAQAMGTVMAFAAVVLVHRSETLRIRDREKRDVKALAVLFWIEADGLKTVGEKLCKLADDEADDDRLYRRSIRQLEKISQLRMEAHVGGLGGFPAEAPGRSRWLFTALLLRAG